MYTVLIIDDDPSCRSIMETILLLAGCKVRVAANGQSALRILHEERPDLILCDIMMPGMDGHSVLHLIKRENKFTDVPFVFVTGLGDYKEIRKGMLAGADDYLAKPFSAEELIATVIARIHRHETIKMHNVNSTFQEEKTVLRTQITKREKEVLLLVGQGIKSRDIAEHLDISQKTVEVHRANLMKKLDATNAASLARWAVIAEHLE